jgi:hypothetical protein
VRPFSNGLLLAAKAIVAGCGNAVVYLLKEMGQSVQVLQW